MDANRYRHLVTGLFPAGRGRRTTALALEHELLTADAATGRAVPIDRVRAAVRGARYAAYAGFEPGGQVELSWPCAPDAASLVRRVRADLTALRADCLAVGASWRRAPSTPGPRPRFPCSWTRRDTSPCSATSTRSARRAGG